MWLPLTQRKASLLQGSRWSSGLEVFWASGLPVKSSVRSGAMTEGRSDSDSEHLKAVAALVRLATVAAYPDMWPDEEVTEARAALAKACGRVPTLDDAAESFGRDLVKRLAIEVLRTRERQLDELVEQLAEGADCHLCGAPRSQQAPYYEFGLALIHSKKHHWGVAAGMLAFNLVTLPFGVAVGPGRIGSTTHASVARCRLALCDACAARRRGFRGRWKVTQADCYRHPSCERLIQQGYSTYLNNEELTKYQPEHRRPERVECLECMTINDPDARFCKSCGDALETDL